MSPGLAGRRRTLQLRLRLSLSSCVICAASSSRPDVFRLCWRRLSRLSRPATYRLYYLQVGPPSFGCWALAAFVAGCVIATSRQARSPKEGYIDRANLSALITGSIWAVPGIFLFVPTSLPLQLFVLFVMGGMAAGTTAGLSTLPVVWSGFVLLSLTPVTVQFLLIGDPLHLMFATLSLVTVLTLFVMARLNYQAFAEGIANRIRLDALAREVEATREQLHDAIESTSDGFVLYDADDKLVMCNGRYREMYATIADLLVPGAEFEDILRTAHERGRFAKIDDDLENWIAIRLDRHRTSGEFFDQVLNRRSNGPS